MRTFKEIRVYSAQSETDENFPCYVPLENYTVAIEALRKLKNGSMSLASVGSILEHLGEL